MTLKNHPLIKNGAITLEQQRKNTLHTRRMIKGAIKMLKDILCDQDIAPFLDDDFRRQLEVTGESLIDYLEAKKDLSQCRNRLLHKLEKVMKSMNMEINEKSKEPVVNTKVSNAIQALSNQTVDEIIKENPVYESKSIQAILIDSIVPPNTPMNLSLRLTPPKEKSSNETKKQQTRPTEPKIPEINIQEEETSKPVEQEPVFSFLEKRPLPKEKSTKSIPIEKEIEKQAEKTTKEDSKETTPQKKIVTSKTSKTRNTPPVKQRSSARLVKKIEIEIKIEQESIIVKKLKEEISTVRSRINTLEITLKDSLKNYLTKLSAEIKTMLNNETKINFFTKLFIEKLFKLLYDKLEVNKESEVKIRSRQFEPKCNGDDDKSTNEKGF